MVMEVAKVRYAQRGKHEFKLFNWWEVVRHQPNSTTIFFPCRYTMGEWGRDPDHTINYTVTDMWIWTHMSATVPMHGRENCWDAALALVVGYACGGFVWGVTPWRENSRWDICVGGRFPKQTCWKFHASVVTQQHITISSRTPSKHQNPGWVAYVRPSVMYCAKSHDSQYQAHVKCQVKAQYGSLYRLGSEIRRRSKIIFYYN
jgi:hypothetical protein